MILITSDYNTHLIWITLFRYLSNVRANSFCRVLYSARFIVRSYCQKWNIIYRVIEFLSIVNAAALKIIRI